MEQLKEHRENSNRSAVDKITQDAGESLGHLAKSIVNTAGDYTRQGRRYVAQNPAKGIAIAAAAGVLLGSVFTLAMRKPTH